MKKFIIKNAMALVALAIATVTLMSFGLPNTQSSQWFAVQSDEQTIDYSTPMDPPGPFDECNTENTTNLCGIEILDGETPATVSDAEAQNVAGDKAHRLP